jgi:hypothetical protein
LTDYALWPVPIEELLSSYKPYRQSVGLLWRDIS